MSFDVNPADEIVDNYELFVSGLTAQQVRALGVQAGLPHPFLGPVEYAREALVGSEKGREIFERNYPQ